MLPQPLLILDYSHFFEEEPPQDRLSILDGISKKHILYELAGLNYRLKPKNRLHYNIGWANQINELRYFCPINPERYNQYLNNAIYHNSITRSIIFNRAGLLFAIEEIINSEMADIDDFVMHDENIWDSILKYLLAVNYEVAKIKHAGDDENPTFENLNPKMVGLNELMLEDHPILMAFKGKRLLDYLLNHEVYGSELTKYFADIVKIEPYRYLYNIMSLYIMNSNDNPNLDFHYYKKGGDEFLEFLSSNRPEGQDTQLLLSIKKAPFYKDRDGRYIVLDIDFLLKKSYNFLINDFWFDHLKIQVDNKGKCVFNIKDFKGAIGYFFEKYIEEIISYSFDHLKHPSPMQFNQLKVIQNHNEIELADLYIRQNKKVILGQVKSNTIYDKEKYSGDIGGFYPRGRTNFFKDFGINQLIDSIYNLASTIQQVDPSFPIGKKIQIFPIVTVSDALFRTPLMNELFRRRFNELIDRSNFINYEIKDLIIIPVNEWEYIMEAVHCKKLNIWELLKRHYKIKGMSPPIYVSINEEYKKLFPKFLIDDFNSIISKYSKA